MSGKELHLFGSEGEIARVMRRAPFLRRKLDCLPGGPGGICFTCEPGFEPALEMVARVIGVEFEWGITAARCLAMCVIGTNAFVLAFPVNTLGIVNVANPAAPVLTAGYDVNNTFTIDQVAPSAIDGAGSFVYIQNASNDPVPVDASFFVVYNVSVPLAVTQGGGVNLGIPTSQSANEGCDVKVGPSNIVYSLLGGDTIANAAKLRAINVSNPLIPVTVGSAVSVGTFSDQPRKLAVKDGFLYVLSGTPTVNNQTIFVYDISNPLVAPVLTSSLLLEDAEALAGVANFFIRDGNFYIMAGSGLAGDTNFLTYTLSGELVAAKMVTTGPSGLAITGKAA